MKQPSPKSVRDPSVRGFPPPCDFCLREESGFGFVSLPDAGTVACCDACAVTHAARMVARALLYNTYTEWVNVDRMCDRSFVEFALEQFQKEFWKEATRVVAKGPRIKDGFEE